MSQPLDKRVRGFDDRWLQAGGIVPVDVPTTQILVQEVQRLQGKLDAANRRADAREREACTYEGRTGCSFAPSARGDTGRLIARMNKLAERLNATTEFGADAHTVLAAAITLGLEPAPSHGASRNCGMCERIVSATCTLPTCPMVFAAKPEDDLQGASGTFACPICGYDKPHHHTEKEVEAFREDGIRTAPPANVGERTTTGLLVERHADEMQKLKDGPASFDRIVEMAGRHYEEMARHARALECAPSSTGTLVTEDEVVEEYHRLVCAEWEKAYGRPCAVALPHDAEKVALLALVRKFAAPVSAIRERK